MKQKSVCFIFESPIQQNMKKVCLLDEFLQAGYKLILCDISYITNRVAHDSVKTSRIDEAYANIHICKTYKELYYILSLLSSKAIVFTRMQWSLKTYCIYRYMEKSNIRYGYISLNEWNDLSVPHKRKITFIRISSLIKLANAVFVRIPKKILLKNGASFIICNSKERIEMYRKRYTTTEKTDVLLLHSNVYDEALSLISEGRMIKEKYCVWLDSYVPYHPDNIVSNSHIEPEKYYAPLRKFFCFIENKYGIKVIIAAHPKSDYQTYKDAYKGFTIIKMNTCLLCRDAEFVMTTASMSIMYPILYKKPLLFIYQDELVRTLRSHIEIVVWLSEEMGVKAINIDHFLWKKEDIDKNMNIRNAIYDQKIKEWIKSDYDGAIRGDKCANRLFQFLEKYMR